MSIRSTKESNLIENRFLWASGVILFFATALLLRLWFLQIYKGDYYANVAKRNRIRRIEIPAPRGKLYDRQGKLLVGNRPFYDLVYIPQYVKDKEKSLSILSSLLHIPVERLERSLKQGYGRPKFLPIVLKRNLSLHEFAKIQTNKIFIPGIEVTVAPRRSYNEDTPPHLVGYLGEIGAKELKEANRHTPKNPYFPGDLYGKQGLESRWESYLRGKRGHRLIQVDAYGRKTNLFEKSGWKLPETPAEPGSDVSLTLDLDLQKAVNQAFKGKYGAVVVLDPRTGKILSLTSSPAYDPRMYQKSLSVEKWSSLIKDPFKPLFDKTTGGKFPPGSIYKAVVALAALQEKVIHPGTTHFCGGKFELGGDTFHCHNRGGHGKVNLYTAMKKSCDVFFYHVGVELGVDRIASYAKAFGLGKKLGVRINFEDSGLVPTSAWKRLTYRMPWTLGDTPNISIGQGQNLMTPMQMANLYASLANGGKVWKPYIVESITNSFGVEILDHKPTLLHQIKKVEPRYFSMMQDILKGVVMDKDGTGSKARHPKMSVAGKTGSVQVVSLKRNRKQTDVSMKWKEHALFAAFSPSKNAEIALVVVSENDRVGGGGASAAPVAGEIIKAYWELKAQRKSGLLSKTTTSAKSKEKM